MDILGGKDACSIKDAYVPYSDKTANLFSQKITLSPKISPFARKIKNRHYNDSLCGKIVEWVVNGEKPANPIYTIYKSE